MSGKRSRNKGKAGERRRIIIDNRSSACAEAAFEMVARVMAHGRVSNGGFCYGTIFPKSKTCVYATKNKASDTFIIIDDPMEGQSE